MLIVGIGGTLRRESSSERALRIALRATEQWGFETLCFSGPALDLPWFDPGCATRTSRSMALVEAMRAADGLILSSPGYHGSISGFLKNALDYTEDMAHDRREYFDGMPVGCIGVAAGMQAAISTVDTLRAIIHSLRGWPTPYAATIKNRPDLFSNDGACEDGVVVRQLQRVGQLVGEFLLSRAGGGVDRAHA